MFMLRRCLLPVMLGIAALLSAGCWDRSEINDLALVMATGLDMEEDGAYRATAQFVIPVRQIGATSANGSNHNFMTESATGRTLKETTQNMQYKLSRTLFVSHRRLLVIGENLARHGIRDLLDYFSRSPTTRLRTYVLVVKGGKGEDLMKAEYPLEFVPSEAIREMENLGGTVPITLLDVINAASAEGMSPVMYSVELLRPKQGSRNGGNTSKFRTAQIAVFDNLKLIGYLDERQSQAYSWLTGRLKSGLLAVPSVPGPGRIALSLLHTNSRIDSFVRDGEISFHVHLTGKGTVEENTGRLDLTNPVHVNKIEELAAESIKDNMLDLVKEVQEKYGSDILGFGNILHRQHNKAWQACKDNWKQLFKEADVRVDVDLVIEKIGMTGPPLQLKEKEIIK